MAAGSVQTSHELLQEKLLVSGYEVLNTVIDKLFGTDIKCIPSSKSPLLILRLPCAEFKLNVPPWMITFEESKRAISTSGSK